MGISLTKPGFAHYAKGGCWLSDARADTLPKDVQALRGHWLIDSLPPAPVKAMANGRSRTRGADSIIEGGWYTIIRRPSRHSDGLGE
jgi:hypothetical protein